MQVPTQQRSRETLDRIVRAAQVCLERAAWAEVTIQDICRAAPASVGSFYARFPDKDALLDHLDDCYTAELLATADEIEEALVAAPDLVTALDILVRRFQDFYARRRGVARAVILRARSGDAAAAGRTRAMTPVFARLVDRLVRFPELTGSRADLADALALSFHAVREAVLNPQSLDHTIPDEHLVAVTVRMLHLHLTTPNAR